MLIVAALPDPAGVDRGHELLTLLNTTPASIDLGGWGLVDAADGRQNLSGPITGGGWCRSPPLERCSLATKATPSSWSIPAAPKSIRSPTRPTGSDPAAPSALAAEVTVDAIRSTVV
jgi:hypothetical protein